MVLPRFLGITGVWMAVPVAEFVMFFGVSPPITDRLYANSRTLDIGKAKGPISPQPVGTVWGRDGIGFPGGCICGTALVTELWFLLIPAAGLKGRALL